MCELPHMSAVIRAIAFDDDTVALFEANREAIIEGWVEYPAIYDIRERLGYTKEEYRTRIARNVFGYFFSILRSLNAPGDCPTMRTVVKEFQSQGLTVEDVFLNCAAFKNVVYELLLDHPKRHELIMVLDHNLYGVLSIYSEMIRAHEAQLELRNRIIQENVLYTRTDAQGVIIEVTEAFCALTGYEKEELIGQTHSLFKHPNVDPSIYRDMWETITGGEVWNGNLPNLRKDGSTFITTVRIVPVFEADRREYMAFRTDITSDELSKVDPLTGLYNRRELDKKFQQLYMNAIVKEEPLCVILADIDHFKKVNDTYGHQRGDELIKEFSAILQTCTRLSDVCARWGGEEFIILLPRTRLVIAYEVAERIRHAACRELGGEGMAMSCSFGVAELAEGERIDDLFKRADGYLYRAKENGRNQSVKG